MLFLVKNLHLFKIHFYYPPDNETSRRRRNDVFMYIPTTFEAVSNEKHNNVSVEHRQDVLVVPLHNVLMERRYNVSRGRLNDVPSVRLYIVSIKPQMKHPTTSQWYVSTTFHWYVSKMSPVSPKWNTQ